MVEFEILVHPIVIRDDTKYREKIIGLLDELQELTGSVEKRAVLYPNGCVSRSHLEQFADASGYSKSDAAHLWAILLRDRIDSGKPRQVTHYNRTLSIRHVSGELRHSYLQRLESPEEAHRLLEDLDLWIIHAGSLCTNAAAIVLDKPRGLGPLRVRLLQEWVESLRVVQP